MHASNPTPDDRAGMNWWNRLPRHSRRYWLTRAGSARPVDAWRCFKSAYGLPDPSTGSYDVPPDRA